MKDNDDEPGSDAPEPPLSRTGNDFERRLLKASSPFAAPGDARRRVFARVLAGETPRRNARARRRRIGLALSVFALAAGAVMVWKGSARPSRKREDALSAEAPARKGVFPGVAGRPEHRTPCIKVTVAPGDDPRIDDFEDRNADLLPLEHRQGTWHIVTDGTGTLGEPPIVHTQSTAEMPGFWSGTWHPARIPRGRDRSRYALHTKGGKFDLWGIVGSTQFVLEPQACYDASTYEGLEFWARGTSRLAVSASMVDTIPMANGGLCTNGCYNRHATHVDLTGEWKRYAIRWSELTQYPSPSPIAFDPKRLWGIDFAVVAGSTPFELWLDDISFLRAAGDSSSPP